MDFANETGNSHPTDWNSLKNSAATTIGFAGGSLLVKNFKNIYKSAENWMKSGCLPFIAVFFILAVLGTFLEKLFSIDLFLPLSFIAMFYFLLIRPFLISRKRKKKELKDINEEIIRNNAYLTQELINLIVR